VRAFVVVALFSSGCRLLLGDNATRASDGSVGDDDGPLVDAPQCAIVFAECTTPTHLRACEAIGAPQIDRECGWGCLEKGGTASCGALLPSGGGVTKGDADSTTFAGLPDVTFDGGTIDGDAGVISNASGVDFHVNNNIAVFRMKSLHITGSTLLDGSRAIAFVAEGPVTIDAFVFAMGCLNSNREPGPGGFVGAAKATDASGSGAGQSNASQKGAGGGGHGGVGGAGGGAGAGTGGPAFGDARITTLVGGGGGGGGPGGQGGGDGGGGGGAIQIVSNTSITIAAGGGIGAGGCGGALGQGGANDAGGGGGAGGAILLEAPMITIAGALAVNGGAGGGSSNGQNGADALLSRQAAQGGQGGAGGGDGGNGGAAANINGAIGQDASHSGGGGGAVGRIRFHTLLPSALSVDNSKLSPALTDGTTTCTAGTATVE
jgi:hypothetical protein